MVNAAPCLIVLKDESPLYLHRDHILSNYLHGGTYWQAAVHTLFRWTNETCNAWTSIVAFLIVHALFAYSRAYYGQLAPFWLFYLSGACHLPFSILCSLFVGVSEEDRNFWRQLDVLFIFSSAVLRGAAIGWSVFSAPAWAAYMAVLILDCSYCITSTMVQRRVKDIPRRELVWDIAGICAGYTLPMVVASTREAWGGELGHSTGLLAGVTACLAGSAVVCSQHIPERWWPGRFDVFGSHAIMHVLVTVEYCLEWLFIRNGTLNSLGF